MLITRVYQQKKKVLLIKFVILHGDYNILQKIFEKYPQNLMIKLNISIVIIKKRFYFYTTIIFGYLQINNFRTA